MDPIFAKIVMGSVAGALIALLGYFLKKQNEKIESVDIKLGGLRETLAAEMKLTKKEVVGLFHDICHERQASCFKVVTARLDTIQKQHETICQKIDELKDSRMRAWEIQQGFNDKIKTHMVKHNGGL